MAITKRFPYEEMKREATTEGRKYITPDGFKLPSVTTILDATKPLEAKKALIEWRRRVGEQKAKEITAEAAGRGTRMHKWLENYVLNDVTGDPGGHPASQQSHKMAHTVITQGLLKCDEFWGTEVSLYFPGIYAGTTDLVGVWNGAPSIIDFKQSNREKREEWIQDYFLQLCFYGNAHNEQFGTEIKSGVIMLCTPELKYQEFVIDGLRWAEFTDKMWARLEDYYTKFL